MKQRIITRVLLAVAAVGLCACAGDGFEPEEFTSTVHGAQMPEYAPADVHFTTIIDKSGNEMVEVTWPVALGASGYEAVIRNETEGLEVVNTVADRAVLTFPKLEDRDYTVTLRALGNAQYGNTDAAAATVAQYSTFVPGLTIPTGSDIAEYVNQNLTDQAADQAFILEAGGQYTLNSVADFRHNNVVVRGDEASPAIVTVNGDGALATALGLYVKHVKFDCTAMDKTSRGIVRGSDKDDDGYGALEGKNKSYIMEKSVIVKDCWVKNLRTCLVGSGRTAWSFSDIRVDDCLVQLDNDGTGWGDASVINPYGDFYYKGSQGWGALVAKDVTIKNSTFYNTKSNGKNFFMRFGNADISKNFGSKQGSATVTGCTFARTMDKKKFGDRLPNYAEYTVTFKDNILLETLAVNKLLQGNATKNAPQDANTIFGIIDGGDKPYCTEEDPGFTVPSVELDLTAPNGGVNFHATGAISSTIGDPRWR